MAYGYAGSNNTFVPDHAATGNMVVGYSRNPKKFAINRWGTIRPVEKSVGYYLRWLSQEAARIRHTDGREFDWPDGADRPTGTQNLEAFEYELYRTHRRNFSVPLGHKAVEQADWAIKNAHMQVLAQKAMTDRTVEAIAALAAASWGSNTNAVDGGILAGGQNWSNGTTAAPNILKSLQSAMITINQQTLSTLQPSDMVLLISPDAATAMCQSQEIREYLMQSPFAATQIRFDQENLNGQWGLPNQLYGFNLVVEDCTRITSRKGATSPSYAYALAKGTPYLVSRPNGLVDVGIEGSPAFSTVTGFFFEEFTVETFDDVHNRRFVASVTTDYVYTVTSPLGGFAFTSAFG